MVTTPDTVALQKGAVKAAQPEQTASNKATSPPPDRKSTRLNSS